MDYRIRPEAQRELRDAARWHEEQEEGLGIDLLAQFHDKLGFALQAPGAGSLEGTTKSTRCGLSAELKSHTSPTICWSTRR